MSSFEVIFIAYEWYRASFLQWKCMWEDLETSRNITLVRYPSWYLKAQLTSKSWTVAPVFSCLSSADPSDTQLGTVLTNITSTAVYLRSLSVKYLCNKDLRVYAAVAPNTSALLEFVNNAIEAANEKSE